MQFGVLTAVSFGIVFHDERNCSFVVHFFQWSSHQLISSSQQARVIHFTLANDCACDVLSSSQAGEFIANNKFCTALFWEIWQGFRIYRLPALISTYLYAWPRVHARFDDTSSGWKALADVVPGYWTPAAAVRMRTQARWKSCLHSRGKYIAEECFCGPG